MNATVIADTGIRFMVTFLGLTCAALGCQRPSGRAFRWAQLSLAIVLIFPLAPGARVVNRETIAAFGTHPRPNTVNPARASLVFGPFT